MRVNKAHVSKLYFELRLQMILSNIHQYPELVKT